MKYFLHDTNAFADEKVTKVFMKYGYEGVGLFFCVLEKLAFQEKPIETKVLKKQLFVEKKMLPLWRFLFEVGLLEENDGEVFNKTVMNVSEKYISKREKDRRRLIEWRANKGEEENETRFVHVSKRVRNTPKENKTKEKESKVNDDEGKSASSSPVIENGEQQPTVAQVNNNITTNSISGFGIEELKARAFKSARFCLEFDGMGVPVEHLEGWLGAFNSWLEYTGETVKQEKDYRSHFKSWLLKQPYKTANPGTYNPAGLKTTAPAAKYDDAEELLRKRYGG